eukprot:CAMPEP_0196580906 /NCGR_PEP_ID=MMETSP1081-20130531/31427_1 /TAXON_ID=36882 /ORGANISM="Pyramimonas amylifera, Strain CCMP720" /LENGTH=62 /DNA_ID=CAMNT_0041900937 /DNA_START=299 /DNA_END=487 /DNA_ORIENTATION=+
MIVSRGTPSHGSVTFEGTPLERVRRALEEARQGVMKAQAWSRYDNPVPPDVGGAKGEIDVTD